MDTLKVEMCIYVLTRLKQTNSPKETVAQKILDKQLKIPKKLLRTERIIFPSPQQIVDTTCVALQRNNEKGVAYIITQVPLGTTMVL